MSYKQVTDEERSQAVLYWDSLLRILADNQAIDSKLLETVKAMTRANNIGYKFGQVPPGGLGRYVMFALLIKEEVPLNKCIIVTEIVFPEDFKPEHRTRIAKLFACKNPEDPIEIAVALHFDYLTKEERADFVDNYERNR